ncbi:rab-GTPase-TBC domain-containing protein [Pilobolus umbonatus]|nr:rab-GTPase-TBC domain-containing protein [Pilobolus umbonatus]
MSVDTATAVISIPDTTNGVYSEKAIQHINDNDSVLPIKPDWNQQEKNEPLTDSYSSVCSSSSDENMSYFENHTPTTEDIKDVLPVIKVKDIDVIPEAIIGESVIQEEEIGVISVNKGAEDTVMPTAMDAFIPVEDTLVPKTVKPVVEDAVKPVVKEAVELVVEEVVEPVIEDAVEPAVEDIVKPAVEDIVEPAVEDIVLPAEENTNIPVEKNAVISREENTVIPVVEGPVIPIITIENIADPVITTDINVIPTITKETYVFEDEDYNQLMLDEDNTEFPLAVEEDDVSVTVEEDSLSVINEEEAVISSDEDMVIPTLRELPVTNIHPLALGDQTSVQDPMYLEETYTETFNPLKLITAALMSGQKSTQTSPIPPKSTRYDHPSPRNSTDNDSVTSTTSNTRSIFAIWSPFRSSSSSSISLPSSRRPSKQTSAPTLPTPRPSDSFAVRQRRFSRPTSIISPLPGFQEALLAQMEQLNAANTHDPKSKIIRNLKRQSIRHTLVSENKGDEYDWDFWAGVMCDYENFSKVNRDLIAHIRFGIPPSIRGLVWQLLAKSKDEELVNKYIDLLKLPSSYDKMIQRDLARTFPGHMYFKEKDGQGQEGLYNVVRAFSIHDPDVGYCQGLAFIVGPLLLNMPDEDAFCLLVQLMNKYGLRGHFTPEMDGLQLHLHQFDALVQDHLPHVSRHLKQQGVNSTMYASQWFMTLFAYKFPLHLVYRIYDVILTEGISSIFKFAISLLKRNQTTILGLDFELLLDFLKNGLFEEYKDDDRLFVSDACEMEFHSKRLNQLEKEYKAQIQKELADANAIEELQKSNLEMKKKLEDLEVKTSILKKEHQDITIELQRTIHELNSLKDEGVSLNTVIQSLNDAMISVPQKIELTHKDQFDSLCSENALLIDHNSALEDRLQRAESVVIDTKMRYAESENDREELYKRLHQLKKIMSF